MTKHGCHTNIKAVFYWNQPLWVGLVGWEISRFVWRKMFSVCLVDQLFLTSSELG